MPTKLQRVSVSVDPRTWATLGLDPDQGGGGDVREWLRREAEAIGRGAREAEAVLTRSDWLYLADACNGLIWSGLSASTILAVQIPAAHDSDRIGDKWYGEGDADRKVAELAGKIQRSSDRACESIGAALRWFWDHREGVDIQEDRWWSVAYRVGRA